ncbi:MAG: FAD-binding oxidoreductase [Pseudomonadales bacterium]|nr:FAD-binding oxidoreductase [Pseudomonadales bacterium]
MHDADFLVIGGGIAGISVAAELARSGSVRVLEQESHLGSHATGRSAALYAPSFGNDVIRRLTAASGAFFGNPPAGFADHALVRPRGVLHVVSGRQQDLLRSARREWLGAGIEVEQIDPRLARQWVPALRLNYLVAALHEPGALDIDVDHLLQGYLRDLTSRGGSVSRRCQVSSLRCERQQWRVVTTGGEFRARVVINAAGAWADQIAQLAGVARLGLRPLRRTAVIFAPSPHEHVTAWPAVTDLAGTFYFKPEAGKLLASCADETLSEPCDAAADEWDVAVTVERVQQATDLTISRIEHRWAGLRTFTIDRSPVIGFDPEQPSFFWFAGQGGYGIQAAPAMARAAAALALRVAWPEDLAELRLHPAEIARDRPGIASF